MNRDQIGAICTKYSASDISDLIKNKKVLSIQCDNSQVIYPDLGLDDPSEEFEFDGGEELIYYTPKTRQNFGFGLNDYTPISATQIFPYDVIQNINIINEEVKVKN